MSIKRIFVLILTAGLLLTLSACGNTAGTGSTPGEPSGPNGPSPAENLPAAEEETAGREEEAGQPSIAGISLGDRRDRVEETLGSNYTETYYDEPGHFEEPWYLWEYPAGYRIIVGRTSGRVLQVEATAPGAGTNLGIKVGDDAGEVLATYRALYREPTSIHGGKLLGVFKVENGQALIFDFNMEDGLVNSPEADPEGPVQRIILTYPHYLDDSF